MKTIKENLKTQAKKIRELKIEIRDGMRDGYNMWRDQGRLMNLKHNYRYDHIAYCMLRGREYSEIEIKVRSGNEVNIRTINGIMERMNKEILERNPVKELEHA